MTTRLLEIAYLHGNSSAVISRHGLPGMKIGNHGVLLGYASAAIGYVPPVCLVQKSEATAFSRVRLCGNRLGAICVLGTKIRNHGISLGKRFLGVCLEKKLETTDFAQLVTLPR